MTAVNKRTIGINFYGANEAKVLLWSPIAQSIALFIINKNLTLPLQAGEHGYWYLTTKEVVPGDVYWFIVDGDRNLPDPASLSQPEGVHGSSEAINLEDFEWTDHEWKNHPLNNYIFYELHTGTFTPEGNFEGIEQKLDYLLDLGINAIEIMPVAQFSGNRNWGYDGVYPFAVQNNYGGAKALQHLVNTCHQKGISVVLDVVYNHLGPEGNYLGMYAPFFTYKYQTPWGNALNFDDAWCDGVRHFFIENALMWLRDFHIDALRLDAVHAIKDFSPLHLLAELKMHVNELERITGRKYYLIVESDLNDTRFIDGLETHGYGMDAQWVDEFHHALRVAAGGDRSGYYSDFNGVEHLAKAYKDAYVYDGQYSEHRKRNFGIKAGNHSGEKFVVFSQNHDQVGNRMVGERTCLLFDFEMQKLLAGAVFVSPFLPMLFMGEEWSEPNPFLYFVNHSDEALMEAVRTGRKQEFSAFYAIGEPPDPIAETAFMSSRLQWNLLDVEPHKTMLKYYKALIALRRSNPVLKQASRKNIEVNALVEKGLIVLKRVHDEHTILCLMNFSEKRQVYATGTIDRWQKVFDSAAPEWMGPEAAKDVLEKEEIALQPESIVIYNKTAG